MKREIVCYGPSLRKKTKEAFPGEATDKLIKEMREVLREKEGVGLAAPQVGVLEKVILVDTGEGVVPFLNPVITQESEEKITTKEGCLSVKGVWLEVERPKKVTVKAQTQEGDEVEVDAEDLMSVIFQHEIDHLNGKLFVDRVGFFKKIRAIFNYYFRR